jgi:predicted O-methyltransferase YrrM
MRVFEFGSGFSTLWWAERVDWVTSVEHDEGWARDMAARAPENATILQVGLDYDGEYCRTAVRCDDGPFHVAIVDGRDRVNCAINCVPALRDDGVIVWDDTQRSKYRPGIDHLAAQGFKRLRFRGMAPRLARLRETSVFYRSDNCFGL